MRKLVIAHRGASRYEPENTRAAFELAVAQGADVLEMDVRKDADGELVLHHDPLNGSERHTEKLSDILQAFAGRARFDLELKEPGYEREVAECALSRLKPGDFMISSFNPGSVRAVKEEFPGVTAGLIIGPDGWRAAARMAWFLLAPKRFVECGDFLVIHKFLYGLRPLDQFSWFCKPVYVWTVDDARLMAQIAADGRVAGVVTNAPDAGRRIISNQTHEK